MLTHLAGPDVTWLKTALDGGLITPDEALATHTGFGPSASIEDLARLLVPRGIDPVRVATLAASGSWFGEESDHLASIVKRFESYVLSEDSAIAAVGKAGVEIYREARDRARENEAKKRVRGEL